jgi:hypothetical protein
MRRGTTTQHAVSVQGKPHAVTLSRVSKSVWIAGGFYKGEKIEMKASSWLSALSRWQETVLEKARITSAVAIGRGAPAIEPSLVTEVCEACQPQPQGEPIALATSEGAILTRTALMES